MKVLYFIAGIMCGIWMTGRIATNCINYAEQQWDRDLTVRTLTGYYEGWARGRDQSDRFWYTRVADCQESLQRCGNCTFKVVK